MIITSGLLKDHTHGFFTRAGGVSVGLYSSLNCGLGSSDQTNLVLENRRRAMGMLGLRDGSLITCPQVHGIQVLTISKNGLTGDSEGSDALVTDQPRVTVGVLTADCAPVLMADKKAGVVAAVHAGWRGALGGVLEATTGSMERLGGDVRNIRATIGPCIGQNSYEVGPEFAERFQMGDSFKFASFFKGAQKENHHLFDLEGYVAKRLENRGIGRIALCGVDTYEDSGRCFSFRRSQHLMELDYGRSLSVITVSS
jgi:YfiH family protein